MKQHMKALYTSALAIVLMATACTDGNDWETFGPEVTTETLLEGEWTVSYYWLGDVDRTEAFGSYGFDFEETGNLYASQALKTQSGYWNVSWKDEVSNLVIQFDETTPLGELNKKWQILNRSDNSVFLEHDASKAFLKIVRK